MAGLKTAPDMPEKLNIIAIAANDVVNDAINDV
jgi:hypothetical protein